MSVSMVLSRVYPLWLTHWQGSRIIKLAVAVLPGALLADRVISSYYDICREKDLRDAFRKGAVPSPQGFVVERKDWWQRWNEFYSPERDTANTAL